MWFSLAFRNLFRNLRRTIAVLTCIALGAAALFSFDGFIRGILMEYREDEIHTYLANGQINTAGYREEVYAEAWKHWIVNATTVENFLLSLPEVDQVFPRVTFSSLLSNGSVTVSGSGQGIDASREASFFHALNVIEGQNLLDQPQGILLGRELARSLKVGPGDTVKVSVQSTNGTLNSANLTVTGIFHTGTFEFDSHIFRIQLKEAQKLLGTNRIESIAVSLRNHDHWASVAKAVKTDYPNLEATSFEVLDAVYYQNSVDWLNAQFHIVEVIILGVVLLGIFNMVLTAILERKGEIGNLRANGESSIDVMVLILTEGGLLGVFGSLIGMGLSYFIIMVFINHGIEMPPGPGQTRRFLVAFHFDWLMVVWTFGLTLTAALVASFFAGLRVARMSIAKALRAN